MQQQRLFWAVSKPLRYLGLTLDEWAFLLMGVIPGVVILQNGNLKYGLAFILIGCGLCYFFRKFKKLSEYFLIKSWLLAKGLVTPPSPDYPHLLNKRIGK